MTVRQRGFVAVGTQPFDIGDILPRISRTQITLCPTVGSDILCTVNDGILSLNQDSDHRSKMTTDNRPRV